jgi:hypothetical protein
VIRVDGPDVAGVVGDLERDMRAANRAVGRDLGKVIKREQTAAIRSSGRGTLSGMRVKLGVKVKVFAGAQRVTVDVTASPPGPWSIREHGRAAVKARGRALGIPGYPRRSARSARGRRTWDATVERAEPAIARAVERIYDEALDA